MAEEALLKRAVKTSKQGLSFTLRQTAKSDKPVVIICPNSSVAEDFLRYQTTACFDCRKACLDVALWKRRSIADARAEVRATLRTALSGKRANEPRDAYVNLAGTLMHRDLFSSPLWLSFGTSAFHLSGLVHDELGLPLRALTGGYTHDAGVEDGLLSRAEAVKVDRDKFKFRVILTSQLSASDAAKYLAPAVPGFDDMTVIYVEPGEDEDEEGSDSDLAGAGPGSATAGAQERVRRPLPAEAMARVEAAILSRDDAAIRSAIDAAKDHWAVNGRYLSAEEQKPSDLSGEHAAGRAAGRAAGQESEAGSCSLDNFSREGRQMPAAVSSGKVARLQADFLAADNKEAVEAEAWTLLEVDDWVEINDVWLELASNADEEWQKL